MTHRKSRKNKASTDEIPILPLVIRSRLGPYLWSPIIIGWTFVGTLYSLISGKIPWDQSYGTLIGTFAFTIASPIWAWSYQVRVDDEFLSYRNLLDFRRIRLADIERIDHDRRGILSNWDQTSYTYSWFVHPRPASGIKGFKLVFQFMTPDDIYRFHQVMRHYFPEDLWKDAQD